LITIFYFSVHPKNKKPTINNNPRAPRMQGVPPELFCLFFWQTESLDFWFITRELVFTRPFGSKSFQPRLLVSVNRFRINVISVLVMLSV